MGWLATSLMLGGAAAVVASVALLWMSEKWVGRE